MTTTKIDGKELYEKLAATKRVMPRSEHGCACGVCMYEFSKRVSPDFEEIINQMFERYGLSTRFDIKEKYKECRKGIYLSREEEDGNI